MSEFLKRAQEIKDDLIQIRRHIHQHPEVGMDLPDTTAYVMATLEEAGLDPHEIIPSGIIVTVGGSKPGKTILLRADMDALPMAEESGLEFASPYSDRAHTCGHDLHTAMLIGAARLLKEREAELEGTVKIMFQPGEEVFQGAKAMIAAGVLENPRVDAALDMHVHSMTPVGHLHYSKGAYTSSADNFTITIKGVGSHGSQPNRGIDPINAAAHVIVALQALLAREKAPDSYGAMSICSMNSGNSFNVIPEIATLQGTMRTYDPAVRDQFLQRIPAIAALTAESFRCTSTFEVNMGTPAILNEDSMVEEILGYMDSFGMDLKRNPTLRLPASDDFGYIAERVPSVMFSIGCKPAGIETNVVHNPKVRFDEAAIPIGAAVFAHNTLLWLKNHR